MNKTKMVKRIVVSMLMLATLFSCTSIVSAATKEVPITKVTFPTTVTMKVGETRTLSVVTMPSNTTYKTNIEWGYQTNGKFNVKVNGMGTYWGKPSSETLTAKSVGTGYLNTRVKVYDSKGKFIKNYDISTTLKVTAASAATKATTKSTKKTTTKATTKYTTKATTKPTTKATTKTVSRDGNVSVGAAYTELNKFRTSKGVWQWNSNNKTKTYFNTNSSNKLTALKRDTALEKTAQLRAKEIATKFSHTRPNGKDCFTAYPSYYYRGENIAYGYSSAAAVTEGWKETNYKYSGQGHRRNMLNKKFNIVGIGCYKKGNNLYWVQCFAKK